MSVSSILLSFNAQILSLTSYAFSCMRNMKCPLSMYSYHTLTLHTLAAITMCSSTLCILNYLIPSHSRLLWAWNLCRSFSASPHAWSQASATPLRVKQLNDGVGVISIDRDYRLWLAVHKRKPLVGDRGPAPAGSLKTTNRPGASSVCPASNDPQRAEVTPWGISFTQADDPLLRSIIVSSSVLFCVIDSGRCRCYFTIAQGHLIAGCITG
jgi:hypothetical protein